MLLLLLLIIPLTGVFFITTTMNNESSHLTLKRIKVTGLITTIINFFVSLIVFVLFNFSSKSFQFVQECHNLSSFDFYLGVDGISIYFVLLTTIIMPLAILSN